jgi:hypothetical protein
MNLNGDSVGGEEIANQLNSIRQRIFANKGSAQDFNDAVTDTFQIDLNDEGTSAELMDTDLMAHMNSARTKYQEHLVEMAQLPELITLRSKHVACIGRISDEITKLSSFYDDYHDKLDTSFQVYTKLNKLNTKITFKKATDITDDITDITKLSAITKNACDDALKQIKSTQNIIFVLRRDMDFNFEQMLWVVNANIEKSSKLSRVVATMQSFKAAP